MPRNITVTKRELKNVENGIDMSVPSHEQASSPKNVKDYHVVVITRLPFFKLPEHSEDSVIQFMVPKDYAAFEKLQKDLVDTFPELSLPDLPRKFHLFMTASDVEDRQVAFDCLVKVVAKNREMCTSVPVLRFLGVDLLADRNYYKDRREFLKRKEEEAANVKEKEDRIFGDRSQEIEQGLFETGSGEDLDLFKTDSKGRKPLAAAPLFEESGGGQRPKKSAKISLLEDDDGELFVPSGARGGDEEGEKFEAEDNSDLLNVSENLDDVLHIVSDKTKKTATKKQPTGSQSTAMKSKGGLFDDGDEGSNIPDMGNDDIMKYIQQNQSTTDDDLELF